MFVFLLQIGAGVKVGSNRVASSSKRLAGSPAYFSPMFTFRS